MEEDTNSFLHHANNTQKTFGHNKFQQEIEDLKREIDKWKLADTEKDMKVNLFRKTIATLQGQLQDKSNMITLLQQDLQQNPDTLELLEQRQTQQHLNQQNLVLQNKVDSLEKQIDTVSKHNDTLNANYEETKMLLNKSYSEVAALKTKLDDQNKQLKLEQEKNQKLVDETNMKSNLYNGAVQELDILKQDLAKLKSANEQLADNHRSITVQLQETEQQLQKQLQAETKEIVTPESSSSEPAFKGTTRRVTRRQRIYEK